MDNKEIISYLREKGVTKVKFAFADIDGVLRGKIINSKKFISGLENGYGFCDVVFGWDSNDELYDKVNVTGWHTGFPDKLCRIDLNTFRSIPWENNMPFFIADFSGIKGSDHPACPRSLLKQIIADCESLGFHTEFAQEFEWFNFKETPDSLSEKQYVNPEPLTPGMFGYSILRPSLNSNFNNDLFDLLGGFGVELEGLHTETGPGVYEAAIIHDEALRAADKAVLLKTAVKEIAYRHGIMASFMAKWNAQLPGCSGHIHQSLWTKDKQQNLFFNEGDENKMSELMKQYLAGLLYCLPDIMPMFAPTINSYKRLVEGAWAPTTVSWGIENRTAAVRVINTTESYTRLEMRVPGSDSNPYLAIAASLAAGLYGIRNKLNLEQVGTIGSAYANKDYKRLSANLYESSIKMQGSDLAKELFGAAFVEHFTNSRLWEWKQFSSQVTDWELKRYFEII
ncbi:glutamine synthetase family protein [Desertivirga arenae]|uniref:glutamine synthetase family protein n=1 Tax=Desertivirga arenae TaxID=2810309 RepID=UPI001A961754|nr:glutamine synthetase family protein [Pedobacter sp. SYSU D00823]